MKHEIYICAAKHDEGGWGCMFCAGGLSACTVCGAFEGAWPDDCPGVKMQDDESDAVYAGHRNFRDGQWRNECCQVMRPVHDTENFMTEAGYRSDGKGGWTREV